MSSSGNQYMLVAQDYFSKWPFARAMPDQKANRILQITSHEIFTLVGPPSKLHSDQGQNFESNILADLCKAFHEKKSHTTPYHPMGDGLVECMNRSLLISPSATYIEKEAHWDQNLQFLITPPSTHPLASLCLKLSLDPTLHLFTFSISIQQHFLILVITLLVFNKN